MTRLLTFLLTALWLSAAAAPAALAQAALTMSVGEGRDLTMPDGASSVLVADPGIAEIVRSSVR